MRIQGPLLLDLYQYAMSLIQSLLKAADGAPLTLVDFDSEHHIPHTKFWPPAKCISVQPSDKPYGFQVFAYMAQKFWRSLHILTQVPKGSLIVFNTRKDFGFSQVFMLCHLLYPYKNFIFFLGLL